MQAEYANAPALDLTDAMMNGVPVKNETVKADGFTEAPENDIIAAMVGAAQAQGTPEDNETQTLKNAISEALYSAGEATVKEFAGKKTDYDTSFIGEIADVVERVMQGDMSALDVDYLTDRVLKTVQVRDKGGYADETRREVRQRIKDSVLSTGFRTQTGEFEYLVSASRDLMREAYGNITLVKQPAGTTKTFPKGRRARVGSIDGLYNELVAEFPGVLQEGALSPEDQLGIMLDFVKRGNQNKSGKISLAQHLEQSFIDERAVQAKLADAVDSAFAPIMQQLQDYYLQMGGTLKNGEADHAGTGTDHERFYEDLFRNDRPRSDGGGGETGAAENAARGSTGQSEDMERDGDADRLYEGDADHGRGAAGAVRSAEQAAGREGGREGAGGADQANARKKVAAPAWKGKHRAALGELAKSLNAEITDGARSIPPIDPADLIEVTEIDEKTARDLKRLKGISGRDVFLYTSKSGRTDLPHGFAYKGVDYVRYEPGAAHAFHAAHEWAENTAAVRDAGKAVLETMDGTAFARYLEKAGRHAESKAEQERLKKEFVCDLFGAFQYASATGGSVYAALGMTDGSVEVAEFEKAFANVLSATALEETTVETEMRENFAAGNPGGVELSETEVNRSVVAAMQQINKKSVNAFTSADTKAAEPFARRYWQEMGIKSPFFRGWFGDWRAHDTTPIQIADVQNDARGATQNKDTGWNINVSGKVFNETRAHTAPQNKAAQSYLPFISDIIKKAILLDSYGIGKPKSDNSLMMHSFYSVADIGYGPVLLKLYVEEMFDPNRTDTLKRAYQLQNIESWQSSAKGSGGTLAQSILTANVETVADLFSAVKLRDKNFNPHQVSKELLNADGTPKTLYHGTDAAFFAFNKDMIGTATGNGLYGNGFYFTDNYYEAGAWSNNDDPEPMTVYLNMQNPYIASDTEAGQVNEAELKHKGYDGVIVKVDPAETYYVAFDPTQIKSAKETTVETEMRENLAAGNPGGVELSETGMKDVPFNPEIEGRNYDDVTDMDAVCVLQGSEFEKGDVNLIDQVDAYFKSIGSSVESTELGTVMLTRADAKSSVAHGIGRVKAMAFRAVPDVIRNGKVLDFQPNRKNRKQDSYVIAAPIHVSLGKYAGDYYVAAAVQRGENDQHFYLHEVAAQKIKEGQTESFKTLHDPQGGTQRDSERPSMETILERLVHVKSLKGGNEGEYQAFSMKRKASISERTPANNAALPAEMNAPETIISRSTVDGKRKESGNESIDRMKPELSETDVRTVSDPADDRLLEVQRANALYDAGVHYLTYYGYEEFDPNVAKQLRGMWDKSKQIQVMQEALDLFENDTSPVDYWKQHKDDWDGHNQQVAMQLRGMRIRNGYAQGGMRRTFCKTKKIQRWSGASGL